MSAAISRRSRTRRSTIRADAPSALNRSPRREIFELAAGSLKTGGYLVTFIGDMYRDSRYHCLSAELAAALSSIPRLAWKANIVWYDVSKKLHLYGYQYSYIPSLIHQNILVFRKE